MYETCFNLIHDDDFNKAFIPIALQELNDIEFKYHMQLCNHLNNNNNKDDSMYDVSHNNNDLIFNNQDMIRQHRNTIIKQFENDKIQ